MRGHGDTGWPTNRHYELEHYVADVEAVIRKIGHPAVLVGASLGGIVALLAAANVPGLASALVMVDVGLTVNPAGAQRVRRFMLEHVETGFASPEEAAEAVARYLGSRTRLRSPSELRKSLVERDGRWFWHWDPNILSSPRLVERENDLLTQAARRLELPTLLIRGGRSDVLDDQRVTEFVESVPHTLYRLVEDAAHMVSGDDNDAFNNAICDFLDFLMPSQLSKRTERTGEVDVTARLCAASGRELS